MNELVCRTVLLPLVNCCSDGALTTTTLLNAPRIVILSSISILFPHCIVIVPGGEQLLPLFIAPAGRFVGVPLIYYIETPNLMVLVVC